MNRIRFGRLKTAVFAGCALALSVSGAQAASGIEILKPMAEQTVGANEQTLDLSGKISPAAQPDCCVLRIDFLHTSIVGSQVSRHWITVLEDRIDPELVNVGVTFNVSDLLASAIELGRQGNKPSFAFNKQQLTGPYATKWRISLASAGADAVLAWTEFDIAGRALPQSSEPPTVTYTYKRDELSDASVFEGDLAIVQPVADDGAVIHANSVPLQVKLANADTAGQCCTIDLYHEAVVSDGGQTHTEWVHIMRTMETGAALDAGVDFDWTPALAQAKFQYKHEAKFAEQRKRFDAGEADRWKLVVGPLDGRSLGTAETVVTLKPATEVPMAPKPTTEVPHTNKPANKPANMPVAAAPVPLAPAAEEPMVEEPAAEEPMAEEPAAEEPAADQPVAE